MACLRPPKPPDLTELHLCRKGPWQKHNTHPQKKVQKAPCHAHPSKERSTSDAAWPWSHQEFTRQRWEKTGALEFRIGV